MRIGILSLYYNNVNYGGLLQSYALVSALDKIGFEAEQICYNAKPGKSPLINKGLDAKGKIQKYGLQYIFFTAINKMKDRYKCYKNKKISTDGNMKLHIDERVQCLKEFESSIIPHSKEVYDHENIEECVDLYDAFICGSDQVWNTSFIRDEYLLKFVPPYKKKIAYAASISKNFLTDGQRKYICDALNDFIAISLREKTALSLFESERLYERIVDMPDPTFLLKRSDWDELILREEATQVPSEDYILCYFLGDSCKQRRFVRKFAKKMNVVVVGFPHVLGKPRFADVDFKCEYEEYECSPARFVNLIKNAKYVITDSFHATVFSIIYQRDFFVFQRPKTNYENSMHSRLVNLLEAVGLENRLVSEKFFGNKLEKGKDCNFDMAKKYLENSRTRGLNFLLNALSDDVKER